MTCSSPWSTARSSTSATALGPSGSAKREVLIGALRTHLPEVRISGTAAGLHLLARLPDGVDEQATAARVRRSGVGVHELHRHCTTHAPSPPALLLGFALPSESDLVAASGLLAEAAS
jgi:GntR family transcriptional regulator/MocR family aminotransferase